jgi:hypothetical protein
VKGQSTPELFLGKAVKEFGVSRLCWGSELPGRQAAAARADRDGPQGPRFPPAARDQDQIFYKTALTLYPSLARNKGSDAVLTRPDKMKLHTLARSYPNACAMKDGRVQVRPDRVRLSPIFPVPNRGFKPMVREHKFDCGELAIVTFLQAREFGPALRAAAGDRGRPRPASHPWPTTPSAAR